MLVIGMLHHRKDPRTVIKSYAYAAVAKAEGAELLYFSPKTVDFDKRIINGYIYENGAWNKVESMFPDVIYNTGSPEKLAKSSEIIAKLKKEIPFTTNSIGNKMRVYKRLMSAGEFSNYLIPSEIVHSTRKFFNILSQYRKIVLKPVNGRKGRDISFVETMGDKYHVLCGTKNYIYTFEELKKYISEKIRAELYLVQPFINCKTKSGVVYDFRLHVQKNGDGNWVITAVYPRLGPAGSIVSNINSGGSTNYLIPFLTQEFGSECYNIKRYLEHFALCLADHMDKIQQDTFQETLDELGIDVALDDIGKLWIYEVNWRPGSPPTFYLELDEVKNMIRYAIYLANLKSGTNQVSDKDIGGIL